MSRDRFEIPEVFRRAMEEAGWDDADDGGDDGRDRRPFPRRPGRPWWANRTSWIIAIIVIFLLSLNWIVTKYTDWLWFTELNYQNVWLKQWGLQIASFAIFFVIATAVLLVNWLVARRRAMNSTLPFNPQFLKSSGIRWLIVLAVLFIAFGFAGSAAAQWESFLRYFYRTGFGVADPIFNQDISFYLFELPVLEFLREWTITLLVISLLGIIPIYAINSLPDIQQGQWQPQQSPTLRQHVALVGAIVLGLWAVGYWLDTYRLLFSGRGIVYGASYTDINASLWALWAQLVFMALTALVLLYNIFRLDLRPLLVTGGLWLLATLVVGGLYPGLLQRYAVVPNELERERPYIEHNIQFTRLAFGLDEIETRPFEPDENLTQQDLTQNETVLRNVRLWDYRPLQDTYRQLQALRPYYEFSDVDIDRYMIDGQQRQVMLAARELNQAGLPNQSWVNRNLEFTHGYGIVMNPVNQISEEGQPEFFIQDLPPQSTVPIEITRPEIYYSFLRNEPVFVGSARQEFSYPSGEENVFSSYEGKGGVPLDSYLKRLAFAIRLAETNVLLSDDITNDTRVQFHRQIQERIQQITPFLELDPDPYIVVWNGRLIWVQDAYTMSDDFPYATPLGSPPFNYIRNAVKITVDAYDGTVNYYVTDPDDPIIRTYDQAFPGLFQAMEELPEGLQSHLRYPELLFRAQTQQYLVYHMTDVRVFYAKEDRWEIPQELYEGEQQPMEPYYVTLSLPGEEDVEYLLIQPFTPIGKPNMIAWAAARSDVPYYGELVVYEMPKQELVFGPIQVETRIDQDPTISEQFTLWDQSGSRVIRGNLLVIPLNDSFLYVEPIYLRSETNALPELKRVIVATGSRIVMSETLDGALEALLLPDTEDVLVVEDDVEPGDTVEIEVEGGEATTAEPTRTLPTGDLITDPEVARLITEANDHYEAAQTAQRNGDWSTYGEEIDALESLLQQLVELTAETQ